MIKACKKGRLHTYLQAFYLGISLLNLNNSEGGLLDGQDSSRVGKLWIVHRTCCQLRPNMARLCLLLSVLIPYKSSLMLLITNIYSWTPCTKGRVSLTFWYMYITWSAVHTTMCLPFFLFCFHAGESNSGSCICEENTLPLGYILATSMHYEVYLVPCTFLFLLVSGSRMSSVAQCP